MHAHTKYALKICTLNMPLIMEKKRDKDVPEQMTAQKKIRPVVNACSPSTLESGRMQFTCLGLHLRGQGEAVCWEVACFLERHLWSIQEERIKAVF